METPKCLAVLLFHNDEDIIRDHINYYIQNNHDIIVFNHNSSDNTFNKIMEFKDKIIPIEVRAKQNGAKSNMIRKKDGKFLNAAKNKL